METRLPQRSQYGFTLIEIVVVISILAILAAVALPRFVSITEESHEAAARGIMGAFGSAATVVHVKWIAQGGGATVVVEGGTVDVNTQGWPGQDVMTNARCADVWNGVLTSPPPLFQGFPPGGLFDGWWTIGGSSPLLGQVCFFVYGKDNTPFRFARYQSTFGTILYFP